MLALVSASVGPGILSGNRVGSFFFFFSQFVPEPAGIVRKVVYLGTDVFPDRALQMET